MVDDTGVATDRTPILIVVPGLTSDSSAAVGQDGPIRGHLFFFFFVEFGSLSSQNSVYITCLHRACFIHDMLNCDCTFFFSSPNETFAYILNGHTLVCWTVY